MESTPEKPAPEIKPVTSSETQPKSFEDYAPLLNRVIFVVVALGIMVLATGVDVMQLAGKFISPGGGDGAEVVASEPAGEPAGGGKSFSLSMWDKGGWKNLIIVAAVLLCVAAIGVNFLTTGGRDVERTKEQADKEKREKEERRQLAAKARAEDGGGECNLASYRLFNPPPEPPAEAAAAQPAEPAKVQV